MTKTLMVASGITFAAYIERGNYGWVDPDLTEEKFSVTADQVGEWEWKLFNNPFRDDAHREMEAEHFFPAKNGQLLSFGEQFPEEQEHSPIAGSGTEVNYGHRDGIMVLFAGEEGRGVKLSDPRRAMPFHRFLGVRRRPGT